MVGIGIVGIGFMGMIHYLAARRLAAGEGRVVALCSRDERKKAGDWTSIRGNFGPVGAVMDLSGVSTYAELGELLAEPAVDLVDLCVPNDEHARMAVLALEAGKHVLVEKPIALSTDDADRMIDAARSSGRQLLVAHVLPFVAEFAYVHEAVSSGRYGAMRAAHFTRIISRPDWSKGITDAGRSGGPAIDLHIHDTHFVSLLCGTPRSVQSRGVIEGDSVLYLDTQYLHDDARVAVSAASGALSQNGRPFTHGFEVYLEGATLSYSSANYATGVESSPLALILPGGKVERPDLGPADPVDAFVREIRAAVAAVEGGQPAKTLDAALARSALAVCLAEVKSVLTGRAVEVV
jgi:predicted dehydrogenase